MLRAPSRVLHNTRSHPGVGLRRGCSYVSVAYMTSPAFAIPWTMAVAVPERDLAADRVWSFSVTFIVVAAAVV